jgi:hypothetical protein
METSSGKTAAGCSCPTDSALALIVPYRLNIVNENFALKDIAVQDLKTSAT